MRARCSCIGNGPTSLGMRPLFGDCLVLTQEQVPIAGGAWMGMEAAQLFYETVGAVFYNPVQEFNRDTSILVINEFN